MNAMLSKICALLESGRADQQEAAAVVLAEIAPKDPKVVRSLGSAATTGPRPVRLRALDALARIGSPAAVPHLLPLLEASDDEIRDRATRALIQIGPSSIKPIARHIAEAPPAARRCLIAVLARVKTSESTRALLSLVESGHPDASREAAQALSSLSREMNRTERTRLRGLVERILKAPPDKAPEGALSAALTVMGATAPASSAATLLRLVGPRYTEEIRRDALLAVAAVLNGGPMPARVLDGVMPLIADGPSPALRSAALEVLSAVQLPASASGSLLGLLEHADPAVRRFAARRLGDKEFAGVKVCRRLLPVLGSGDPALREAAAESLGRQSAAASLLLEELLKCDEIHRCWTIAHTMRPHLSKLRRTAVRKVFDAALGALTTNRRIWEPMLYVVRHHDPKTMYEWLMEASARFKKARKYAESEACLRPLSRGDHFDSEARYALALAGIKAARSRGSASSPAASQAIDLFRQLIRDPSFPLVERLKKERSLLEVEDLYHLGFQLAEGTLEEKEAGAELLRLVAVRAGSGRIGRSARNKLRSEGLGL